MERKDFIKGLAGLTLAIPLLPGCGSDSPVNPGKGSLYDSWEPSIDEAYNRPGFSAAMDVTDSLGRAGFVDRSDNSIYNKIFTENFSGGEVSGLEVTFYKDHDTGKGFLMARDPQGRFMPNIVSINDSSNFLEMRRIEDSDFSFKSQYSKSLFIENLLGPLPSYDPSDLDDLHGYFYIGDWSFDSLKNVNSILKNASAGITFLFPNPVTATAYSIFEASGNILSSIDSVVDGINLVHRSVHGYDLIDLGREHSIYGSLSGASKLVFFPSSMSSRSSRQDIRDLFPINEGNSWTFTDGRSFSTSKVLGKKNIKGDEVAVVRSVGGLEEYFGFNGNSLRYVGFNFPGLGDVFFEPSINFGNNNISIGSEFRTSSNIISSNPEISGTIISTYRCVDRENVLLNDRTPYGDCYKIKESISMEISNGGDSASDGFSADHWFAKELGKVRSLIEGEKVELFATNIQSRMEGFGLLKDSQGSIEIPNISGKIISNFRKLV